MPKKPKNKATSSVQKSLSSQTKALVAGGVAAGAFATAMTAAVIINDKRARERAIAKVLSLRARSSVSLQSAKSEASRAFSSIPSSIEQGQEFLSARSSLPLAIEQGQEFFSALSSPLSLASLPSSSKEVVDRARALLSARASLHEDGEAQLVIPLVTITNNFAPLYSLIVNFYVSQRTGMMEKIDFWYANGERALTTYPWQFWLGAHRSHVTAKASFEMELAHWTKWWNKPLPYIKKQGLRNVETTHEALPPHVSHREDIMEVDIECELDRISLPFIGTLDPEKPFTCRLQTHDGPFDRRTGGTFRLTLPKTWTLSPPAQLSSEIVDINVSRRNGKWVASHAGESFDTMHLEFETSALVPMMQWKAPSKLEAIHFLVAAPSQPSNK